MGRAWGSRITIGFSALALLAAGCGSAKKPTPKNTNPNLPGITAKTVKIGMWWGDLSGACAALHVTSPTTSCGSGDERDFKQLTDYINAHGGMAGRTVIPVIYHTSFTGLPWATQAQQACTYFTQDSPVYAVITPNNVTGEVASCLALHHVIVVDPGTYPHDNQDFVNMSPYLYQPNRPRPERWLKAYIDGLATAGFFSAGVKVGLIRYDWPETTRVTDSVLKPELAAKGITLTEEAIIPAPTGADAFGSLQTAVASEVLKFKSAGIDRIIEFTDEGYEDNFLYTAAASQHYFPRYGLSSTQFMTYFVTVGKAANFNGAVGIGWNPGWDIHASEDPGGSSGADLCKTIINDPKNTPTGRNNHCDSLLFLKTAFDKARQMGDLTPAGIQKAVATIGSSFQPAEVFSMTFGPGLYDGPSSYRVYGYDSTCSCFKYTGPVTPMPETPVAGLH